MPALPEQDGVRGDDERWIARALALARQADYRTSPNPMVGAVVVDARGQLAGEGFHSAKGGPHAEQLALAAAGERARGASMFVNLEPCTHGHRSPSCAEATIQAGVRRVVVAMEDPDRRVAGSGIASLRAAGIEVTVGLLEAEARRLNEFYIAHRRTGRPFVAAKFAMSLDGKIATTTGESRWISGKAARRHAHGLRHAHDAILVGVNTVVLDDPELSAREGEDPRQPLRVVLDSHARTPSGARVLGGRTIIASTQPADRQDAEILELPPDERGRVGLGPLLDELGRRGVLSVLVEGGAETHASFFEARLVDKVYAYVAPVLIGGGSAPGPIGGAGITRLADSLRLRDVDAAPVGHDILISGYVDVHRDS